MKTQQDIQPFADLLQAEQLRRIIATCDCEVNRLNCTVTIKMGQKFAKVDIGSSGRYMVDLATGEIYGIKAYGVVHRGHRFGTLDTIDQYDWSDYRGVLMTESARRWVAQKWHEAKQPA